MHDRGGPDEEDLILLAVPADLQLSLEERQQFALLGHLEGHQARLTRVMIVIVSWLPLSLPFSSLYHRNAVMSHGAPGSSLSYLSLDHLGADVGLDDVAFAHIANAEHEAGLAITLANDGVAREEEGLGALFGPRQLGEHDADHEGLQDHAGHGLDAQREDRLRAFVRRVLRPVPASSTSSSRVCERETME